MERVTEKWFLDHGWRKQIDVTDSYGATRTQTSFVIGKGSCGGKLWASYAKVTYTRPNERAYSFYTFFAKGNTGFCVDNRCNKSNFPVHTIISAMNTVGYDEYGKKLKK